MPRPPGADASLCGRVLLSARLISRRRPSLPTDHETVPRQVGRARRPVLFGAQLPRLGRGRLGQRKADIAGRKIPGQYEFRRRKSLLAKIGGGKSETLLAKKAEPTPPSASPAAPPSENQPSLAAGRLPPAPYRSFRLPSALSLGQPFVSCRLGPGADLLGRMLNKPASFVLISEESSTYPRGYASGSASPAALLDGLFEHPARSLALPHLCAGH